MAYRAGLTKILAFVSLLFVFPTFAAVPGSTLEDFFTAAINYSPDLQIAQESLNIGAARKKAANGQLLPQINAGGSVSDNRLKQFNNFQNFDGERYYLSLTQVLFNWQAFSVRKQAYLREDQLEEEYYYQLAFLLTDVAEKYFNVLQAEDALDSIASEIDAVTNQLNQIQSLYDRQLAQITDLYQGRASLAAVQAEELQLEAEVALSREALRSISGLDVGPLHILTDEAEITPLEFSQQYYVQQARERNHQILAREYALRAAEEGISERRGAYMPRVSFIAQRQDSDVGFDNLPINRTDNTYIGLDVSIPLYAGGSNRAAVSEASSRRSIAEYELRAIQLETRASVRAAHLQVQSSEAQANAGRILVESTALAAEAMQQGFLLGTVTSVDVLNALRDQYQAERELQRTRYEHVKYLLLLKRETGTLSSEDLLEVGSWLEPAQP
jgi:outer membrane protein